MANLVNVYVCVFEYSSVCVLYLASIEPIEEPTIDSFDTII